MYDVGEISYSLVLMITIKDYAGFDDNDKSDFVLSFDDKSKSFLRFIAIYDII